MHKWLKVSIFPTAHDLDLERSFFAYLYDMAVIKARTKVLLVSQKRFQDKYLYFLAILCMSFCTGIFGWCWVLWLLVFTSGWFRTTWSMGSTFTGLAFKSVFVARALSVKYGRPQRLLLPLLLRTRFALQMKLLLGDGLDCIFKKNICTIYTIYFPEEPIEENPNPARTT